MHRFLATATLVAIASCVDSAAQPADPDETRSRLASLEGDVETLKSVHISGYIQAEWQQFDQTTTAGGRALFSDARRDLFTIRRGRIKVQHRFSPKMFAAMQTDITERGVGIKDAYVQMNLLGNDQSSEAHVTVGAFNRPNYEVEYSSSSRESPERALITRAFYPDERDLGVMLTFRSKLSDRFDPRLQVALFNGTGLATETDAYKDLIARVTVPLPFDPKGAVRARLGASFYYGGIPQLTDSLIVSESGVSSMVVNDALGSAAPGMGNRRNVNVEGQVVLDVLPVGTTIIKAEYMTGRRPTAAVTAVPRDSTRFIAGAAGSPFQLRNQNGYYLYVVQNIGKILQVVAKADMFDRNTDLQGSEVTSVADASATVVGFGLNYFLDNVRLTAWYEIPSFGADENIARGTSGLVEGLRSVDLKDNKTTLRIQYKF